MLGPWLRSSVPWSRPRIALVSSSYHPHFGGVEADLATYGKVVGGVVGGFVTADTSQPSTAPKVMVALAPPA